MSCHEKFEPLIVTSNFSLPVTSLCEFEIKHRMRSGGFQFQCHYEEIVRKIGVGNQLTIKARCPMHLEKFPMDDQSCPMRIASYGYEARELEYYWFKGNDGSISYTPDLKLSQFDLVGTPAGNETVRIQQAYYSSLYVHFSLERHMGYFLIQVYVPCTLLVILSWVAFWINREATADRIALGITTVLTMAFLSIDNRTNLPKVSYSTALDWYLGTCFAFVLATILQFSGVHYFTKHGSGEVNIWLLECEDADEANQNGKNDENDEDDIYCNQYSSEPAPTVYQRANGNSKQTMSSYCDSESEFENMDENVCSKFMHCLKGSAAYRDMKQKTSRRGVNSVSKIDRVSRILFPAAFTIFNLLYWSTYLHIL